MKVKIFVWQLKQEQKCKHNKPMATSILHIKTEIECKVFLFDEEKGIATPGKYFNLEVRKGEQDLLFVSTADKDIQCSLQYEIEETDCDYRIMIEESQFKAKTGLTQDSLFKLLYTNVTPKEIEEGVEDEYGVIYSSDGSQLLKCKRDISSYQVKEGCRLIRKEAFIDKKLSSIILPDGLTHIGDSAFGRCKNLFSINFPDGLIHIGDKAFYRCENLYSITLPNGLMQIGEYAFLCCESLSSITLPNGLKNIGNSAFQGCKNLSSITLPNGLTHIGHMAFFETQIRKIVSETPFFVFKNGCLINVKEKKLIAFLSDDKSVDLPIGLTHIGDYAFSYYENLSNITLPNGLKNIGDSAFQGCKNLSSITLPDGLTHIGVSAFSGCKKLSSIILPNGLTHIGDYAFSETQIRKVVSHTPCFLFKNGCLINVRENKLIVFLSDDKSVDLPIGLTHVEKFAFSSCKNLISITLPIGLTHIGDSAFRGCENLSSITLPVGLTHIGDSVFSGCKKLFSITLPNGLTHIGNHVFDGCKYLFRITMPNGLTYIGDFAFRGCENLSSVNLPDGLTHIGDSAFWGCENLSSITLPIGLTYVGNYAFSGCNNLSSITLPNGLNCIGYEAFNRCAKLSSFYISSGMREHFEQLLPKQFHDKLIEVVINNKIETK